MVKPTEMETASGIYFDINNPDPGLVNLHDIAWHLSRIVRFTGAGSVSYSVGQHSIWGHDYFKERGEDRLALLFLFHDAHETYTGDISTPFKNCPGVREAIKPIQDRVQKAIYLALNIPPPNRDEYEKVKRMDTYALLAEAHHVMPSKGQGWGFDEVPTQEMLDSLHPIGAAFHIFESFLYKAQELGVPYDR